MRRVREGLTYSNVVSSIALFLALGGGTVYAVAEIGSGDIKDGVVRERHLSPTGVNPRVPPGSTIRGAIGGDDHAHDADASDFGATASFQIRPRDAIGDDDVHVNVDGWLGSGGQTQPTSLDDDPACDGTPENPEAPPGEVCIYVSGADHAFNLEGFSTLAGAAESRNGFKLKWDASQEGDTFVDATWAYTASEG